MLGTRVGHGGVSAVLLSSVCLSLSVRLCQRWSLTCLPCSLLTALRSSVCGTSCHRCSVLLSASCLLLPLAIDQAVTNEEIHRCVNEQFDTVSWTAAHLGRHLMERWKARTL